MKTRIVIVATICLYIGATALFRAGHVMATSRKDPIAMIKVREIRRFPLLLFPLAWLDDNPTYRFEFYRFDSPYIWSAFSYTGESYTAQSAQIAWEADGSATVYLEHHPIAVYKDGVWSSAHAH